MQKKSRSNSVRVTRRTFAAGAGAAAFVAGAAPFNIVRAQGGPLKVGVILPRSGYEAGIGQDCQRGVDIAPAIFKSLGLPELTIINGDTESNVDTARARARETDRRWRPGSWSAPSIPDRLAAIAQVAEQKGHSAYVINIAAAPAITEQGYKFVFRNFPTAADDSCATPSSTRRMFSPTSARRRRPSSSCTSTIRSARRWPKASAP